MKDLSPSDLKTILHSKRANMYYLEHCRVMQKDGRMMPESAVRNWLNQPSQKVFSELTWHRRAREKRWRMQKLCMH